MPQFDKVTFFNQIFWLLILFLGFYTIVLKYYLPKASFVLKLRSKKIHKEFAFFEAALSKDSVIDPQVITFANVLLLNLSAELHDQKNSSFFDSVILLESFSFIKHAYSECLTKLVARQVLIGTKVVK